MKRLLPLILLAGCAVAESPHVVSLQASSATDAELESAHAGALLWEPCGFEILPLGDDSGDITISIASKLEAAAPAGWIDLTTMTVWLNQAYSDYPEYQEGVVAHELGHALLKTAAHLPSRTGIMSSPHHGRALTPADYELACQEAGRCCEVH